MPHVLIVDDDAVQAAVYERLLAGRGITSQLTSDTAGALDLLERRAPDAILVDLGLPRLDGVELIRRVRALPAGHGVRVFVLANAFLELEALAAWEAGADQVVGKATHGPEQVIELLVADIGGTCAPLPADPTGVDPALATFLERATSSVRESRGALARVRSGGPSEDALEELATSMRRLQAAQAFGVPAIPQLAAVTEWLARALVAWPSSVGPSSLRTLDQALDLIERRVAAPAAPVRDLVLCRALCVDDDPTSRLLLQQAFRKIKVPCDAAPSGAAALEAAAARRYDLVVSDVMMPGMDGFTMVAELRKLPGYAMTPVLYVTALDGFDGAFVRDSHGGTDAMVKPYLIMELATKAVVHLLSAPA